MPQNFLNLNQDHKETLSDRLLKASANATSVLLTIASLDDAVNTALKIIGEALDTDRVTVIENFNQPDQPILCWRLLYEWDAPHTMSQIAHPEVSQGTIEGVESWIEKLSQGERLSYCLDEIPEPFRSGQEKLGVKVLHIVPIFVEGRHWGEFGFDDCREFRERGQAELATLQIIANSIGGAIQRERSQQALLRSEQARITQLTKVNAELLQRDRIQDTTTIVANTLLTIAPFETAIKTALKFIGEALDADRVNIIENFNHPLDSSSLYWRALDYEWCSPNTVSQFLDPDNTQGSYADIPSLIEIFTQGKSISYVIEDMPEPFRSKQIAIGVKSTHIVPIFIEGNWWGVLGLDDCREVKHRSPVELSLLNITANCIGSAIQRDRTQKALLCSEQERTTELESANKALRNAIAGMARLDNLEYFLAEMLRASLNIAGAHTGAVALIEGEVIRHAVLFDQNGWIDPQIQMSRGLTISPFTPELQELAEQFLQSPFERVISPDDPRIMPEYREFHREHNNKAIRLVPMQISDRLIGWLEMGFIEDNPPITKSFGILKVLAEQMTMAVEIFRLSEEAKQTAIAREREQVARERTTELESINTELQQALNCLRTTEQRFRTLFESSNEGFYFVEVEPPVATNLSIDDQCTQLYQNIRVILANSAFASMYGFKSPNDCIGLKNANVHISCSEKNAAFIRGLVENGYNFRDLETEEVDTNKQIRYFLNSGRLTIKDGYIVGGWGSQTDITQLRQTQQALLVNEKQRIAKLEKANETLSRSLSWLAREEDLNKFLEQILLDISATLQAKRGHLFVLHQPSRMLESVARVKDGKIIQDVDPSEPSIFALPFSADITPLFSIMEQQNLFTIMDMTQLSDELKDIAWPDSLEWHRQEGHKACAALVLKTGDRSVGFLGLGFREKQEIVAEKQQLVIALANQAALAILLMQLAEQSKQTAIAHEQERAAAARVVQLVKANAVLKQTLDVLATEPEIESSLGHVLKVSSEQLDSPSSALWLYNAAKDKFYLHLVYMDNQIIPVTIKNIDLLAGKWLRGRKLATDLFLKKHIRERSPAIYQVDDASVVPPPLRRSLENMGVKTLLGIPLLLGSEIIGSFTLRFTQKRQFQAEELELTQALANQATLAIQLLRMAEEAKQAAIYEERNRLAGEIHDTLAQAFTGISLQLGVVKWLLQEGSLAIEPILDRINDIAQTGLAEARRSVWEIYPTAQEYANLAEKLSQSVEKLTRDRPILVNLQILGSEYQVSAMIGYNLLKLAQEAITNALKHGKATQISIILTYKDALVSLSITDNGCGFQPNLDNGGFGLLSISERCDRIGGQLAINSRLGQGTEVSVEVPLK